MDEERHGAGEGGDGGSSGDCTEGLGEGVPEGGIIPVSYQPGNADEVVLSQCFLQRLGLKKEVASDTNELIHPLLSLMQTHKLDFHSTFRMICTFRPPASSSSDAEALDAFIAELAANSHEARADDEALVSDWRRWLEKYAARARGELAEGFWTSSDSINSKGNTEAEAEAEDAWTAREKEMRDVNPRFVLRQWVLEEIIKRVQDDPGTGKRALAKVHQVRRHTSLYVARDLKLDD